MSYLTTNDVLKHIRRKRAEGVRCAVVDWGEGPDGLPEAWSVEHGLTLDRGCTDLGNIENVGEVVERLVLAGHRLVYVAATGLWTLAYAGEPLASVQDVDTALADGDGIDVRAGELWIESPAGSGSWHLAGRILDSVADHMRRKGLVVA